MDRNAIEDTKLFFFGGGSTIMGLLITAILAWVLNQYAGMNALFAILLSLLLLAIMVQIINEIRWAIMRNNGFVEIVSSSSEGRYGKENFAWLTFSPKNKLETLKLHIRAIRGTYGRELGLSDLLDIKNGNIYIVQDLVMDGYPKKIPVFSIIEDYAYLFTQNKEFGEDGKIPFRILLDKEKVLSEEKFEIVLEIIGKINDRYTFTSLYKGVALYYCATEPDIIEGQHEARHRSCEIKWIDFSSYTIDEESKRPLLREIRNFADRIS